MRNFLAVLIVIAVRIMESKPKPKLVYSESPYHYDDRHEDWNDYLRDTGL